MSMNATFVQVEDVEIARFRANPSLVEMLFETGLEDRPLVPPAFAALTKTMQDRVHAAGPQLMAGALAQLDPALRQQIEASLGRTMSALAAGEGGDTILKLMEQRQARGASPAPSGGRAILSLDKAWHGVHYVLCGEIEPGTALLSQAVLGGTELGDDPEGFSGYGPARYFTAEQVAELAPALSRPKLEAEASARFDPARMSELGIYPGWQASHKAWVMDGFRRLRDFYADAASHGRAILACLV